MNILDKPVKSGKLLRHDKRITTYSKVLVAHNNSEIYCVATITCYRVSADCASPLYCELTYSSSPTSYFATGKASGYGYDKCSAAIIDAAQKIEWHLLDACDSVYSIEALLIAHAKSYYQTAALISSSGGL